MINVPHPISLPRGRGPVQVQVQIGSNWLAATAHGLRDGRRGRQILVCCHGRLVWVTAIRVRRQDEGISKRGV
jgi:hypothetical protein